MAGVNRILVKKINCFFERKVTKFGNGAKIDVPKEFFNKSSVVLVVGDSRELKKEIQKIDAISARNILGYFERKVVKFGTGAKINISKDYLGKKVIVAIEKEVKK